MASLDWSQCPAAESIPGKRSGAWVFRDTRTPVSVVFENLEAGATIGEVMDWFHVTREQVAAVLEFAARSLDTPPVDVGPAAARDPRPTPVDPPPRPPAGGAPPLPRPHPPPRFAMPSKVM